MRIKTEKFHCLINEKSIGAPLSSNDGVVVVSGAAYVPVADLNHCKADVLLPFGAHRHTRDFY